MNAGGVDHGIGHDHLAGAERDRSNPAAVLGYVDDAVGDEGRPWGVSLGPKDGEEHLGIEPAVADGQHAGSQVVGHQLRIAVSEVLFVEPLGDHTVVLLSFEIRGKSVTVVLAHHEHVAVGAPVQFGGRLGADSSPVLPVVDRVEGVLRQPDVLWSGEQLPHAARALACRCPSVGAVVFDDHHIQRRFCLLEVERRRTTHCACSDHHYIGHLSITSSYARRVGCSRSRLTGRAVYAHGCGRRSSPPSSSPAR